MWDCWCFGRHFLVTAQPRTTFRLLGFRPGPHPVQFPLQAAQLFGVLASFHMEPGRLGVEAGSVVALIRVGAPTVEFEDPLCDIAEKVAVVGHCDDGARTVGEVLFEPLHAFCVEVAGRFVQQQQIRLL